MNSKNTAINLDYLSNLIDQKLLNLKVEIIGHIDSKFDEIITESNARKKFKDLQKELWHLSLKK